MASVDGSTPKHLGAWRAQLIQRLIETVLASAVPGTPKLWQSLSRDVRLATLQAVQTVLVKATAISGEIDEIPSPKPEWWTVCEISDLADALTDKRPKVKAAMQGIPHDVVVIVTGKNVAQAKDIVAIFGLSRDEDSWRDARWCALQHNTTLSFLS